MSNINNSLISSYLYQVYLVAKHQDLASKNESNQLPEMIDVLAMFAEAIGNANAVGLASVDEDSINVVAVRNQLANKDIEENAAENVLFTDLT
jgi:hypothetical protein